MPLNTPFLYLKSPVETINDLYLKYKDGGRYGWYALCNDTNTFSIWDVETKRWKATEYGVDYVPINHIIEVIEPEVMPTPNESGVSPNNIDEPYFLYLKRPVQTINDLYLKYKDGGRYGWYAIVYELKTFAYWNVNTEEWQPMIAGMSVDGREVEIGKNETHIQWRRTGDLFWTDLISISELKGNPGDNAKSIEIRNNGTYIQWGFAGNDVWTDLIETSSLIGNDGNGISSIVLFSTDGIIKTYRITFTDTTTFDYVIKDGENGESGKGISGIALTKIEELVDTYTIYFTDNSTLEYNVVNGKNGTNGIDGITPHIGENNNWFFGNYDSGISALALNGVDGITPHIGENGNWFFSDADTGIKASGEKGNTGIGITSIIINDVHNLIITLSDGSEINCGNVQGQIGDTGENAYDMAVLGGYTGTLQEFYVALANSGNGGGGTGNVNAIHITTTMILTQPTDLASGVLGMDESTHTMGVITSGIWTPQQAVPGIIYELYGQYYAADSAGVLSPIGVTAGIAVVNITYSSLKALRDSNKLITGQIYLINNYRTTYIQPTSNIPMGGGGQPNENPIEPLLVEAISSNKLSTTCKSQLYPQDIIYYDIDKTDEGFTMGGIYRRIDTINNNDIGTDWRHIKYRRYKLNVTNNWVQGQVYTRGTVVVSGNDIWICVSTVSDWLSLTSNFFQFPFDNLTNSSQSRLNITLPLLHSIFVIPVDNSQFSDNIMFSNYDSSIVNNTIECYEIRNNAILGTGFSNNKLKDFRDNTILGNFQHNIQNKGYFYNNYIGAYFTNNKNSEDTLYNTITSNCIGNDMGEFYGCLLSSGFSYNKSGLGVQVRNSVFGNQTAVNEINKTVVESIFSDSLVNNHLNTPLTERDCKFITEIYGKSYTHYWEIDQGGKIRIEWIDSYGDNNIIKI